MTAPASCGRSGWVRPATPCRSSGPTCSGRSRSSPCRSPERSALRSSGSCSATRCGRSGSAGCGSVPAGVYLAIHLMRNVTFDEPLSYQRRLVKGEFSRQFSQPVGPRRSPSSSSSRPIGYLSAPVRRAMGWDVAAQQPLAVTSPRSRAEATWPTPTCHHINDLAGGSPRRPLLASHPTEVERPPAPPSPRPNPYTTSART